MKKIVAVALLLLMFASPAYAFCIVEDQVTATCPTPLQASSAQLDEDFPGEEQRAQGCVGGGGFWICHFHIGTFLLHVGCNVTKWVDEQGSTHIGTSCHLEF